MSLRLKFMLSFITASLAVVLVFAAVAYTNARDYTLKNEIILIQLSTDSITDMLKQQTPTLDQIERILPHHGFAGSNFLIVDSSTEKIVSNHANEKDGIDTDHVIKLTSVLKGKDSGLITSNNNTFLWASSKVPGTPYIILTTFKQHANSVIDFLKDISTSLGLSIFIAFWISFWAATILANLFDRLAKQKAEIEYKSRHDPLTSLPNRHTISDLLRTAMIATDQEAENLLFCIIDVHGLKDINDSLGHESGDEILRMISERLKDALRSSDKVGRFGGDKFAAILTHSKSAATIELCTRLLSTLDSAFKLDGHSLYIAAALGVATYPEHAENAPALIQKAEIALHKAKATAKDFVIFDAQHDHSNAANVNLSNDLRNAIRDGQLQLHYQAQMDLRSGKIMGAEALARWIHPEHGFIPPDTFIDIAERTGLIKPLTEWVLATAIKQCAEWRKSCRPLTISINLSARNLHDETLTKQITRLIRHWQIIPDQICLEITETAMMADPEHAKQLLDEFDSLGLRLSIDDFGTGYSSLGYLKKLPVDEIKIDKSFVMNMKDDENDASIIRATVGLAHDLGLTVVAEGVENQESLDELKRLGCEIAQGYHISRPIPADDFLKLVLSQEPGTEKQSGVSLPANARPSRA